MHKEQESDGLQRKKHAVSARPMDKDQMSEIDQLRQQIKDLKAENAYLKAVRALNVEKAEN